MKNVISILLIFMVGAFSFGETVMVPKNPGILTHPKSETSVEDAAFVRYVKEIVPYEYRQALIYYTDNPRVKPHRAILMGIADQESEGWKYFISHKPNKDGSIDHSPFQLNSNNIKNKKFMALYAPKDRSRITSLYTLYMVTAINYFVDYCIPTSRHGYDGALAMYNSNPNNYFNGTIPDRTWLYVYKVRFKAEKVDRKLEEYARKEAADRKAAVEFFKNPINVMKGLVSLFSHLQPYKPEDDEIVIEREEMVKIS